MSDNDAYQRFKAIRWAGTNGKPVCPHGCDTAVYESRTRRIFTCKGCFKQFSVTSGTIFSNRKLPMRDLLAAIAIFVNGVKGTSAIQMSRTIGVDYKTAFVLAHKLREAMAAQQDVGPLTGRVEIDGAFYGGYIKPKNQREKRIDRRIFKNDKEKAVVVMRQRKGGTRTFVAKNESEAAPMIQAILAPDAILYTDEASAWARFDKTHQRYVINHKKAYAEGSISTNLAESFHSRMRRSEIGVHHHFAGPYLGAYAAETAWRQDHCRISNGEQFDLLTSAALSHPVSRQWKGYWQRRKAKVPEAALQPALAA